MFSDSYYQAAYGIAGYLAESQCENGSFPAKTTCAETFSLFLWSCFKDEFNSNVETSLEYYLKKDKRGDHLFPHSWEFNNYALLHYYLLTSDPRVIPHLKRLKFEGIKVANWRLLRAACRLLKGGFITNIIANLSVHYTLFKFQKNGFIWDEKSFDKISKSFQYHSYSLALLCEIYGVMKNNFIKKRFLKGIDAIIPFILPNGDTLYIGRGQEQVFGYGALIYALESAWMIRKHSLYKRKAKEVLSYLLKFQREDGSFPLVLRVEERGYPITIDTNDDRFLGWYRYNGYFDYISILGYYLVKASQLSVDIRDFGEASEGTKKNKENVTYQDDEFLRYDNAYYTAVVSKPQGYWTNDMPFPYVCYRGESIFPCYGGEQRLKSLYEVEGIPLPFGRSEDRNWARYAMLFYMLRKIFYRIKGTPNYISMLKKPIVFQLAFREFLKYRLGSEGLIGESRYLVHVRRFKFKDKTIEVEDFINFKKRVSFKEFYPVNFLFFQVNRINDNKFTFRHNEIEGKLTFSAKCYIEKRKYYCSRGELVAVREKMERIAFGKGDMITRLLIIELV